MCKEEIQEAEAEQAGKAAAKKVSTRTAGRRIKAKVYRGTTQLHDIVLRAGIQSPKYKVCIRLP